MRFTPSLAAVALALAILVAPGAGGRAEAQTVVWNAPAPFSSPAPYYPYPPVPGPPAITAAFGVQANPPTFVSSRGSAAPVYLPPYSYYVAPYPFPARGYVGFGSSDAFPFYGRPYGHPFDPWSWEYLSGYPSNALARYYYPPLG